LMSEDEHRYIQWAPHINERVGWLTFCVGVAAEVTIPLAWDVPTLGTAINCLAAMNRIGLLILLISAIRTKQLTPCGIAGGIFAVFSVVSSFASGFSFLRTNTILPLLFILFAASGFALKYMLPAVVAVPLLMSGIYAWLRTRTMIREGIIAGLELSDQWSTV